LIVETEKERDAARIQARLKSLEAERIELEGRLSELQRHPAQLAFFDSPPLNANQATVPAASSTSDKIALFRQLFVGRSNVFPIRWANRKAGKASYAPACANEWVKGVCANLSFHSLSHPIVPRIFDSHFASARPVASCGG
jgi:hypothetical protein